MKKTFVFGAVLLIVFFILNFLNSNTSTFNKIKNVLPTTFQPKNDGANKDTFAYYTNALGLTVPVGYSMSVYADLKMLGSPRVLAFDKNGDLYATLTKEGKVVYLPDSDSDSIADKTSVVLNGLVNPHGMIFDNKAMYLAETNQVVRYSFDTQNDVFKLDQRLFELPTDGGHFTRTLKLIDDKLYTVVGSSCNVCNEKSQLRAAMLVSDITGNNLEVFANGLRNSVFFVENSDGTIWATENGRDLMGDNLPPDEINIIQKGGNYGWPYCFGQQIRDNTFGNLEDLYCQSTQKAKFDLPAHVAPLGLAFIPSIFSTSFSGDLLVAFHGSWNSTTKVGYKIVKLSINNGEVTKMEDFITGFMKDDNVLGRPVDLLFKDNGSLLVSDDYAKVIYIVTKDD